MFFKVMEFMGKMKGELAIWMEISRHVSGSIRFAYGEHAC